MRLLIVEDDPRLLDYLETSLKGLEYSVLACRSIDEAQSLLQLESLDLDLVILDRMVQGREGADLIKPLKAKLPNVGILILSSLDMPAEKAKWIDAGADDYMGKPFALEELVSRLRMLLRRRGQLEPDNGLHFKNLKLDLLTHSVNVGSLKLDLTKKEFQLLMLLLQKPGRVYSKMQILEKVWDIESTAETNVVEVTIRNIRKKLQESSAEAEIFSRRNVGYWLGESET